MKVENTKQKEPAPLDCLMSKKSISRRDFMKLAAAAGITGATANLLWQTKANAAQPKKGGTLRVGMAHGSTTDTLDPSIGESDFALAMAFSYKNNLIEVSNEDKLIPELAEHFESSPDAATWMFKLRKGVEFHNGKTLDADDVIASIQFHRTPHTKSVMKPLFKPIKEIKKDGPDTILISLEAGNADFPFLLSDFHMGILPSKNGEVDWRSGIGTGGYMIETFEPGVVATFKRNPSYWKAGRAHFDRAEITTILDSSARMTALVTGAVDVIDRLDFKTADMLATKPGVKVEETSGTLHYSFSMRCDTAPFSDNNVRLALKHALPREVLLDKIIRGHGYVGNDHPIGKSQRYYAAELPQHTYDVDKAKYYLKKAGYDRLKLNLSTADAVYPGAVDAAVLFREYAAPCGIDINVVREANDGYWSNVYMKKPWFTTYYGGRFSEDLQLSMVFQCGVPWNDTYWCNERFDTLLKAARVELDQNKRREMYVEMQRLLHETGGILTPLFVNFTFAMQDKVQHGPLSSKRALDGQKFMERWWFAG